MWQVSVKNLIAALEDCPAERVAKLMAALEIEEVCVCVRERERECLRVCVCVCVSAC